jgi:hypothetical protein
MPRQRWIGRRNGDRRAVRANSGEHEGYEVDVVLEDARGRLVGVEVKATRSPDAVHRL